MKLNKRQIRKIILQEIRSLREQAEPDSALSDSPAELLRRELRHEFLEDNALYEFDGWGDSNDEMAVIFVKPAEGSSETVSDIAKTVKKYKITVEIV